MNSCSEEGEPQPHQKHFHVSFIPETIWLLKHFKDYIYPLPDILSMSLHLVLKLMLHRGEDEIPVEFPWGPAGEKKSESRWWEVTSSYFASSDVPCLSPGPCRRRNLCLKCFHRWSSPQADLWCCFPFYYLLPEVMKRDSDQRRAVWSSRVMKVS